MTIKLQNESETPITVVEVDPYRDYQLSCVDRDGAAVPLTKIGERLRGPESFDKRASRIVDPGRKIEVKLSLGKVFAFPNAGNYVVSTKRNFYSGQHGSSASLASSNKFSFTLTN